jgi:ribosomal protein S18 acetylase RimI-like enzyme
MTLVEAVSAPHLEVVRALFREYQQWTEEDLCFQSFEEELAGLPGRYASPSGQLLLAYDGTDAAGCAAIRALDAQTCELKRMYVRDAFRGRGLGELLLRELVGTARKRGFRRMRLDTLPKMTAAQALYRKLGFEAIAPYYDNPIPGAVYLEAKL